ncbi:MAG: YncE family protein [Candidatus Gastranaerophilaceae bacterium]
MKKIIIYTAALIALICGNVSDAIVLPHDMRDFVLKNMQGSTIRFDGLVNLNDGTLYMPVIPAQPQKVSDLKIIWSYPEKSSQPDIIVFNNNYSLLKVIKNGKRCTLTNYDNLPEVIKTGIFPQDMLVPNGFYISENMRALLGNIEIPIEDTTIKTTKPMRVQSKAKPVTSNKKSTKIVKTRKKVLKVNMPIELKNKMYLVTNFDSQYLKVFAPGRPEPIYGLKLKGILKDINITPDKKYIIAAIFGKNQVDIADIRNEQIAKSIDIDMQPSEIALNNNSDKFYVLSTQGKAIFAINLKDMSISEKISLDAVPYQMTLSPDNTQLVYADKNTNSIYILKLDDEYKNVPVTKCKNISKMILDNNNRLFVLSRTENALIANDYNLSKPYVEGDESESTGVMLQKKIAANTQRMLGAISFMPPVEDEPIIDNSETATVSETKIAVGLKPTDMYIFGDKLFVLSSGNSEIEIYDKNSLKLLNKIKIPFNGFPRKITRVDNSNLALVTDTVAKKYAVINLANDMIIGTYPLDIPVYSITVIDKINNINLLEQTL